MNTPPKIENAPGLTWRNRKSGWEARWQCRTDLSKRGYPTKSARLWFGTDPTETDIAYIQSECNRYQADMLIWGRGGIPQIMSFDGTWGGLIDAYQRDKDSPYRKLRYATRVFYDTLCRRIIKIMGQDRVADTSARRLLAIHAEFVEAGHLQMGHAVIGMMRTVLSFGSTILADKDCREIRVMLHDMRFPMGKPRSSILTADWVVAIRAEAHKRGKGSIALAQAFQFDFMFRQKDVLGEWVPVSEPGISDVIWGNSKWLRGLRWEEIDGSLRLTHVTSKRGKEVSLNLRNAPMVMEELDLMFPGWGGDRANLPANGPILISETHGVPWIANEFRRHWRIIATVCGVPRSVRNMDSRAGAITEATEAGAPLESIKHAATHADIQMTQRYARNAEEKAADVAQMRVAHRNKTSS